MTESRTEEGETIVTMSETEFGMHQTCTHFAGVASGWEDAAKFLRKTAGDLFAAGDGRDDRHADRIRVLALECESQGKRNRETQKKEEARLKEMPSGAALAKAGEE